MDIGGKGGSFGTRSWGDGKRGLLARDWRFHFG